MRPFMTWLHKDQLLDDKDKEIERLMELVKNAYYEAMNDYGKSGVSPEYYWLRSKSQQTLKRSNNNDSEKTSKDKSDV